MCQVCDLLPHGSMAAVGVVMHNDAVRHLPENDEKGEIFVNRYVYTALLLT
jgi:hypothetical protein